jgi:hypothetical protein
MQIEDKIVNLAPGMAVTVEIKTGAAIDRISDVAAAAVSAGEFAGEMKMPSVFTSFENCRTILGSPIRSMKLSLVGSLRVVLASKTARPLT